MGCSFELGIVSEDKSKAIHFLNEGVAEIERIENLLSEFRPESQISQINQHAGENSIQVDEEVFLLLQRCSKISAISKGYFDISVGPLKRLYNFKNEEFTPPDKIQIAKTLKNIGHHKIQLNDGAKTVKLKQKGMKISLAAIGKGYAADVVCKKWKENDVIGGYVDASGDLTGFGKDESGSSWKVGIANPDNSNESLFYVPLNNASVATSGDYEQHFMYQGKKYSHNIDPKTGRPVHGVKSVSVFSPSAELSDALATAVYTMGIEKGIAFIDQLPQTHCIIINDKNNIFFSKELHYETVPA
ncbi:FAD:protein FMN transferase [Flagellimonas amphidinii]|nr:FAD:protein FMN transferase [Allomuricauda amphidinii]MDC6364907.1 FAD:protein FMN transferase [Muricauda sp. AC10]